MSDIAIRVENLSKRYRLGRRERYRALRDTISDVLTAPIRMIRGQKEDKKGELLWAVKDVSFDIHRGEAVGIIGRNGAGKSTLLKILSRITDPTSGRAEIYGRVGSLLEVGTGFHPELTGRENIFLNGAILGMRKAEITRKFDEIVAFAEVERFIDTPVKRYSSGMYVRLAFAVAAHLEPEIMLVDEVLAVGDAAFQKKCLGKMGDVAREGRTVLFVSHNMAAVGNLCQRGVVLSGGEVQFVGSQGEAISHYLRGISEHKGSLHDRTDRRGSGEIRVVGIELRDDQGKFIDFAQSGQDVNLHLHYETKPGEKLNNVFVGVSVKTQLDVDVFFINNRVTRDDFGTIPPKGTFILRLPHLPLPASTFRIGYSVMPNLGRDWSYYDTISDAMELNVIEGDFYGSGEIPPPTHGVTLAPGEWRIEPGA